MDTHSYGKKVNKKVKELKFSSKFKFSKVK